LVPPKKKTDLSEEVSAGSVLVRDAHVWKGTGISKGSILIEKGKIKKIAKRIETRGAEEVDASGLLALPGLIDVHVHLRDMELAYKEDFASGTAAAAAGGFTSILDMPNTKPPTDSPERLRDKQEKATLKLHVNVGFHAAAVADPAAIQRMASLGAFSLKFYMPRPISPLNAGDDRELIRMMKTSRNAELPLTVHAEDPDASENGAASATFLDEARARSGESESKAVDRIIRLQQRSGCRVHFCHLTLMSSISRVRNGSRKMTTEVTPHHVLLSETDLLRLKWRGWMVPPLRSRKDMGELRRAMSNGRATLVASDHAPHAVGEKDRPPGESLPGVPGLETTLPLLLTLVNKRLMTLSRLVKLLATNPARVFDLPGKGRLQVGADGDVVLVDLKKETRVDSSRFFSKARFSPFDGVLTRGAVRSTIVNGTLVYHDGAIIAGEGSGRVLRRSAS
jgi:dihydroorotase